MTNSFARVKEVFEQWAMYDAVVQADYMAHAELASKLSEWASQQPDPLKVIDLGCGDAWLATHGFQNANVARYLGVDVSESAIERARGRVAIWPGRTEVVAGNLAESLHRQASDSANVVLASYSLHHFASEDKINLIAECRRVLAAGGTFIWIDAVRREDETRADYINRLTRVMGRDWIAMTLEQRERACAHVRESDFPETAHWMLDHVRAAGFHPPTTILEGDFFRGWAFVKPGLGAA